MTYGEEAELVARAVTRLIELDALPLTDDAVEKTLACRAGLLNSVLDQLHHLGADRRFAATPRLSVKDVAGNTVNLLHQIARQATRPAAGERLAPSDALAPVRDPETVVELWRQAAVAATAATHELTAAQLQPWLHDRSAGWYLVRDVANTLEGLVVLDARMTEVGLLPQTAAGTLTLETQRMVTAHAARIGGWQATSMSPDLATAARPARSFDDLQVLTVERPTDLAAAQRQLASMLRHPSLDRGQEGGLDVTTARAIATGQARLAGQLAIATALGDAPSDIKTSLRRQHLQLADVQARLSPLSDIEPRCHRRALFQQQEIGQALRRFTGHELSPAELRDLAEATHTVATGFAVALRHALHHDRSNIRILTSDGYLRAPRTHPLSRALLDLANTPAPEAPAVRLDGPKFRASLRFALDATPTGQRRTPYPATTYRRAPRPSAPGR